MTSVWSRDRDTGDTSEMPRMQAVSSRLSRANGQSIPVYVHGLMYILQLWLIIGV